MRTLLAALAVLCLPVTVAAEPPSRPSRAAAAARWVEARSALARRWPGAMHAGESTREYAYLAAAGDLDGDGAADVLDGRWHATYDPTTGWSEVGRFDAYRGRDGKRLWSLTTPSAYAVLALPGRFGPGHEPGLLVLTVTGVGAGTEVAGAGTDVLTATAYDRAGRELWSASVQGALAAALAATPVAAAYAAAGSMALPTGVLDGGRAGGSDLLVTGLTCAEGPVVGGPAFRAAGECVTRVMAIGSATGEVRDLGAPVPGFALAESAGDFDGDGADDVLLTGRSPAGATATARTGDDGATLWSVPVEDDFGVFVQPLGDDVTGDGRADVRVTNPRPSDDPSVPRTTLLDGGTGAVTARLPVSSVTPAGNVDGKGGRDVIGVHTEYEDGRATLRAAAYTGTGTALWRHSRRIAQAGNQGMSAAVRYVGDVHGDGRNEITYTVTMYSKRGTVTVDGMLDGRTGRRSAPPRGTYWITGGLDRRGADTLSAASTGRALRLHARSGRTGGSLWTATIAVTGKVRSAATIFDPDPTLPVRIDGDRCGDVVVSLRDGAKFTDVVVSGATGRPLWAVRRSATGAPTVLRPRLTERRLHVGGC
jgi:hypothetical protein